MARRTGLREFQLSVAERLRTAATRAALSSKLGFQVGGENWFVALHQVSEVIPVPPVRITTCTRGSAHASRTTRATSVGSSRTIVEPTTTCPAAPSSSRITVPPVSFCGVRVSDTVRTKQPTDVGALALCSSGVDPRG